MKKNGLGVSLLLILVGLLALATGCASGSTATPTPTPAPVASASSAAPASSGTVLDAPALAFDKLHVDLGDVTRSQEGMQTFLVMNRGDSPLEVGPVTVQVEQGCDAVEAVAGTMEVRPGGATLLPIKLGPHRELGPHRLLVSMPSTDPAMPVATLSISFDVQEEPEAPGAGPHLSVDKGTIDIGSVPYDWPLYEQFALRNDGDAPLVLEGELQVRVEEGC